MTVLATLDELEKNWISDGLISDSDFDLNYKYTIDFTLRYIVEQSENELYEGKTKVVIGRISDEISNLEEKVEKIYYIRDRSKNLMGYVVVNLNEGKLKLSYFKEKDVILRERTLMFDESISHGVIIDKKAITSNPLKMGFIMGRIDGSRYEKLKYALTQMKFN